MTTVTFTTAGANTWTCPAGVEQAQVQATGGGGTGGAGATTGSPAKVGGGGGGGGEFASEPVLAVTPGLSYPYTVGAAGAASSFGPDDNGLIVTANAGGTGGAANASTGTPGTAGAAGSGSANTSHFSGGAGHAGAGSFSSAGAGGGGAGSGGTGSAGNAGGTTAGATAVTGGGPGGSGGASSGAAGTAPASGPGGGGGGGSGSGEVGGAGSAGQVVITYTPVQSEALTPPGLALAAQPVTLSGGTRSQALAPAPLVLAAQPVTLSGGSRNQAVSPAPLVLAAQPVTPRVISLFPRTPLGLTVELLLGTTWTDITSWVYFSEANDSVSITRGRPDESAFTNPSTCSLKVNNRDGRFSPKNPSGAWWGLIGRNTQIRVSVQAANPDDGTRRYRFWGELSDLPMTWSPNDVVRDAQLSGAGVLRRLQQSGSLGTSPTNLPLPLTAYIAGLAGTSLAPVAWWPCTDIVGSTQFASGIAGGPAMTWSGTPTLASSSDFPGSDPVPVFGGSQWFGLLNGTTLTPGATTTITDTFSNATIWTCPDGVTELLSVTVVGPGGGGAAGEGGGSPASGGGGGGGGVSTGINVAVTPGTAYTVIVGIGGAAGVGGDGGPPSGDSSFPGDSATITGGAGSAGERGGSGGDGGSGDTAGGAGGTGNSGTDTGGGGGGAGGQAGGAGGPFIGDGLGGLGGQGGGSGGSGGLSPNGNGGGGQTPGGGGGGGSDGSGSTGGPGGNGSVSLTYQQAGESNVGPISGGPQNANVLRFLLDVPAAGDTNGAPIAAMVTSGTVANVTVYYQQGFAVLSAALGSGSITTITVNPTAQDIPSGTLITVNGSNGTQQFTTSGDTPLGSISITITSSVATITTAAGSVVTLGTDAPGYLNLILFSSGGVLTSSGLVPFGCNGTPLLVSAEIVQSGSAIDWTLQALAVGAEIPIVYTGTLAAASVGSVGAVVMNPFGELTGTACGQVTAQYATSPITDWAGPLSAFAGETAGNRFARLCAQVSVAAELTGDPDDTVPMGAQPSDEFVNLIQDCELADRGQVYEPRDQLGLGYRTRVSMLSQTPTVVLNYAAFTLPDDPPPAPRYDDQYTSNDVTIQRTGGSQLEVTLQSGRLSVQPPPAGVGPYSSSVEVNLATDGQLPDLANWLLNLSTVDEYRFPVIAVRAEYAEIAGTSLWAASGTADIGDYVQIPDPPSWLTPDTIRQLIFGVTETIKPYSWVLAWNCVPESPWEVAVSDDGTIARADTSGSTLVAGVSSTATALSVATTLAGSALWTTAGASFPFDVVLAGERMTVTNITGTTSPQAFTVTRSVNGVAKAHLAAETVALFYPPTASI